MKKKVFVAAPGFCFVLVLMGIGLLFSAGILSSPAGGLTTVPFFQGLGCLSQEGIYSKAWDLSANGAAVTGWSGVEGGLTQAFHWTEGTGMIGLPFLVSSDTESEGDGLSSDGLTVAGHSGSEACRWTWADVNGEWKWIVEGLGDLSGGDFSSRAYAMSYDGQVVVGEGQSTNGTEAFRWTASGGMVGLGDFRGGDFYSRAFGCSSDGSVVVGQGHVKNGGMAFSWTAAKGMVQLGVLPKRKFSAAWACSGDGSVVVGQSWTQGNQNSSNYEQAFRWTAATGMVGLGELPGGIFYSEADGVSPDGSFIVGGSGSANGVEAFIWNAANGMRRLADYLAERGTIVPAGWILRYANGVTVSNGVVTFAGWGVNPNGETEAWVAAVLQ